MFPRLRRYLEQQAAENRVGEIGLYTYVPGMTKDAFRASVKARIDLDPLKPLIKEIIGNLLDLLIDQLFDWLEATFGGGGAFLPFQAAEAATDE